MTTNKDIASTAFFQECHHRINSQLKRYLPPKTQQPTRLHRAMNYAVFNGGKRLRPLLVYATGYALEISLANLDAPALAVEFIHCYSLIHDDLPSMDNDDWRRGQLTCHKAFNEATAILAGDALQSLAFYCLDNIEMTRVLAKASGSLGMAGGQDLDLAAENQSIDLKRLEQIHRLKTGALIEACIDLAVMAAGYQKTSTQILLQQFAQHIGIAFQIQDDILDLEGNRCELGKTPGIDRNNNKATYVTVLGLKESKCQLQYHYEAALSTLNQLNFNTRYLEELCAHITARRK